MKLVVFDESSASFAASSAFSSRSRRMVVFAGSSLLRSSAIARTVEDLEGAEFSKGTPYEAFEFAPQFGQRSQLEMQMGVLLSDFLSGDM